jgi:phosphate transport system substrate-binding protein
MVAAIGLLTTVAAGSAIGAEISGAGATFPYPIYARWAEAYKKATGVVVSYQPVGSGEGIRQIQNKEVTFGASDMPLKQADLEAYGLVQFPTVIGGVVPVVNIEGIKPGELTIDGPTLAKIFLGEIKSWNDAALRRLNPTVKLPSQGIAVVHRSDGSGTTFVFTDYLSKISSEWKSRVGSSTSVKWPLDLGGKGNEGVAGMVRQTQGAIGYVELIYALQNNIPYGPVENAAGNFVKASLESTTAAASSAKMSATDFRVSITNAPGKDAYPISTFTYLLVPTDWKDKSKQKAMVEFLNWMLDKGQGMVTQLNYAALPESLVEKQRAVIATIH